MIFAQSAFLRIISGQHRGPGAALVRMLLIPPALAYRGIMAVRNWIYDRGLGVKSLPRPVISIGNLTTGGTGKTPVVQWLCDQLRRSGRHPAILMRGYKAAAGEAGDEQAMLENLLKAGDAAAIPIIANADRHRGGAALLERRPDIDALVLDDGFQHRRLFRQFDLVLIDATSPFGYGWMLPRGLLREPVSSLRRASAILMTRVDQVTPQRLGEIEAQVRRHNQSAPIFRCAHVHAGLRCPDGELTPLAELRLKKVLLFAGIGNPAGLLQQVEGTGAKVADAIWFPDHWHYGRADLDSVFKRADELGVRQILTTEKDWVKIRRRLHRGDPPIQRLELRLQFHGDDEAKLLELIEGLVEPEDRRIEGSRD